jgi:integrase
MALHKITTTTFEKARRGEFRDNGRRPDGGGLYLRTTETGAAGWVFRYGINGKERFMGGGSVQAVTLREARQWAAEQRRIAARGDDPVDTRRQQRAVGETFWTVAERVLADVEASSLSDKHKKEWRSTLERFVKPALGERAVASVTRRDVIAVLQPIWRDKHATASRLRGRIEAVFDSALAAETIDANPARWHDLRGALGRFKHVKTPHAAMAWQEVPHFVTRLRRRSELAARALELVVLTGTRASETLNATWGEIDFDGRVWRIAADRMKAGRAHSVPLSGPAIDLLTWLRKIDRGDYVFPGRSRSKPLNIREPLRLMADQGHGETVHGFRSALRSWAADHSYPRELAESALAHVLGGVEAAYQRSDLVEARRPMMEAWATWCCHGR